MSWLFRRILRFGPFRTTLSKGGVGMSWSIPGFRFGISANGRKYFTIGIPGTGIYFTKFISRKYQQQQLKIQKPFDQSNSQTVNKNGEPWWKQKNI